MTKTFVCIFQFFPKCQGKDWMFDRVFYLPHWIRHRNELVIALKECSLVSSQEPHQDGTCNKIELFPRQKGRQDGICNKKFQFPF